jgi:integrase
MSALTAALNPETENIIPLAIEPKARPARRKTRFNITQFQNRTGSQSWRVSGYRLDGSRVRENFSDETAANCRRVELECEFLRQPVEVAVQATKLTPEQLRVCEAACLLLGDDWGNLVPAVEYWRRTDAKNLPSDSPRLPVAVKAYVEWLNKSDLRPTTRKHWRNRVTLFQNSLPAAVKVSEITTDDVLTFLRGRNISAAGQSAYRGAVSHFFSWCIERPRRWARFNPVREIKIKATRPGLPDVLSVSQCEAVLRAAETHKKGLLVPYLAVCLFAGLRPFEAARLTWEQVNLEDGEILIEPEMTKTKRARVVKICATLAAWLRAHKGEAFFPSNHRKEFDMVKNAAGLKDWTPDILRHSAISYAFRASGSFGLCAEQFGNSESIIKKHYKGLVSTKDAKAFYRLLPTKGAK